MTCLNNEVFYRKRNRQTPREWLIGSLRVEHAIRYIIGGTIINYKYDFESEEIVPNY